MNVARAKNLRRVQLGNGQRKACSAKCGETIIGSNVPLDPGAMAWKDLRGRIFCTRGCAYERKNFLRSLLVAVI